MENLPRAMTLRDLVGVLARHRVGIITILSLSLSLGWVAILLTIPAYESQAVLLVEGRTQNQQIRDFNDPVTDVTLPARDTDIQTQIEVLQSSKMLFDAYRAAGIPIPNVQLTKEEFERQFPRVRVVQAGSTNVLQIRVESPDPDRARQIADTLPQVYQDYVNETRRGEVDNALQFLSQRQADERKALAAAELQLQDFKLARSLLPLEDEGSARSNRVNAAQQALSQVQASVASAQERLNALVASRKALPATLENKATQVNTPQIEAQKNAIADLMARREALAAKYLPDHPEVVALDAQISAQKEYLAKIPLVVDTSTSQRHPDILWLEERIAEARATLKGALAEQAKVKSWVNDSEMTLKAFNEIAPRQNELARTIDERKASIAAIVSALEELRVRRNSVRDPVTTLSQATEPEKIRPKGIQYIAISLLMGLLLATGFALIRDSLENRVTGSAEVYDISQLPILAEVPQLSGRSRARARRALEKRRGEHHEVLKHNLNFALAAQSAQTILFSCPGPNEGEADVAWHLGLSWASEGKRILIIDANSREPSVHEIAGLDLSPGLMEVLEGETTLDQAAKATDFDGFCVLPSGTTSNSPADLLASSALGETLAEAKRAYDMVLIVGPHLIGLADSYLLASAVDAMVVVVGAGKTRRAALNRAMQTLTSGNVRILGTVVGTEGLDGAH